MFSHQYPRSNACCGPFHKCQGKRVRNHTWYKAFDFKQECAQVDNYGPKTCPMAPAGAPATSANGATSAASSASPSTSGASIATGAIVGIVVGVAALLALLAALLALFLVRRRRRDANDMGPLHMLPIHKHFSQGGKVGNSLAPLGQNIHVITAPL